MALQIMNRGTKNEIMQISKTLLLLLQYSNILVATCAHCDLFVGYVFRLTLSLVDVAPTLISIEENIQEYFKVSLRPLSCCICVLSYGSM